MKTMDDKERVPLLLMLMSGLLSVPSSDADCERGHSLLRTKINSDQRSHLVHSTIVSLMSFKFNCDSCCFDTTLPKELLTTYKTYKSLYCHIFQFHFNDIHYLFCGCGLLCRHGLWVW